MISQLSRRVATVLSKSRPEGGCPRLSNFTRQPGEPAAAAGCGGPGAGPLPDGRVDGERGGDRKATPITRRVVVPVMIPLATATALGFCSVDQVPAGIRVPLWTDALLRPPARRAGRVEPRADRAEVDRQLPVRPDNVRAMSLRIQCLCIDCNDPNLVASFWEAALGWRRTYEVANEIVLEPPAGSPEDGIAADLVFVRVPEPRTVKNRLHLDLRPADQAQEVDRLLALGARRVSVGQPAEAPWIVLADPEGNELCIREELPAAQ